MNLRLHSFARYPYYVGRFFIAVILFCAAEISHGKDFVDVDIKFSPSAEVETRWGNSIKQVGRDKGVKYKFYSDGSGTFGKNFGSFTENWEINCKQDAMEDYRICIARKGDLNVGVIDDGMTAISIGTDHYPRTGIQLRIGSSPAYKADEHGWVGEAARPIFQRLLKAQSVTTRYQKWPDELYKDKTIDLFGLSVVYEYMKWAVHGQNQRELQSSIATDNSEKSTSKPERTDLIRVIQFTLNLKGYDIGEPDGLIGPRTRNAIKTYQTHNGLPPDGKPSIELLNHLVR